ncbi:glycosyltransferase family 1 protein [Asticcacaulis sp. 201]|uniref:glycosyltransferase family 4 protein n=1 Tax=Asticcacaulis sp. 201 TaxID=3028787 RepID=UPI002916A40D|nr:glycosyltransferase family 1 protein [Asticcacaulis sp. 201]MDV6331038.1 glycosyltransferase family 1 protein [Asticcacaulis sp. 201]
MRLCLDLQVLQGESADRGVGRYSAGLAKAILEDNRVALKLLLNTALTARFDHAVQWAEQNGHGHNICAYHGLDRIMGLIADNQRRWRFSSALYDGYVQSLDVDAIHFSAPFDGMGDDTAMGDPRLDINPGIFQTATLYDLIPFEEPDLYLADARYRQWFEDRFERLKRCDCLFAISNYTRNVAIQYGISPDKIVAISSDTDEKFKPLTVCADDRAALLHRIGIDRPFVMHTGILETRKNVRLLLDAFAQMPQDVCRKHQIVLVANATDLQKQTLTNYAIRLGIRQDQLVFAGFLNDLDLIKLYNITELLVMPSLKEGFGLPLLEAMRCGAPVLGAKAASIPEVVGADAYLFDPRNASDLSAKMLTLLTNPAAAAAARHYVLQQQARFSWKSSADIAVTALLERWKAHERRTNAAITRYYVMDAVTTPSVSPGRSGGIVSIPLLQIKKSDLSSVQEAAALNGPFGATFAKGLKKLCVSRELAYFCEGYGALSSTRSLDKVTVAAHSLKNMQNAVGVDSGGLSGNQRKARQEAEPFLGPALSNITTISDMIRAMALDFRSDEAAELSQVIGANFSPRGRPRTLLVDISELVHRDAKTGIQRVVRSILLSFLSKSQLYRIEPIYREGTTYRYARQFTARFLGLSALNLTDSYVVFNPGDIFLGLDLDATITPEALDVLKRHQCRGVRLVWIVYDILPVVRPEWFDAGLARAVSTWVDHLRDYADELICISKTVADEVKAYYSRRRAEDSSGPEVSWWHLGADLEGSMPTKGVSSVEQAALDAIPVDMPIFLTVGTVEPRKGIHKLLDGADSFWASGAEGCFIIVGKTGWAVDALVARIRGHREFGCRLFWFEGASDEILARLYRRVTAALLPSEGEGFGLPLVEAARWNLPIVARNIPVFKEIAGSHAFYFTDETPGIFSSSLKKWLALYNANQHPKSDFPLMTWEQSAHSLIEVIADGANSPDLLQPPMPAMGQEGQH